MCHGNVNDRTGDAITNVLSKSRLVVKLLHGHCSRGVLTQVKHWVYLWMVCDSHILGKRARRSILQVDAIMHKLNDVVLCKGLYYIACQGCREGQGTLIILRHKVSRCFEPNRGRHCRNIQFVGESICFPVGLIKGGDRIIDDHDATIRCWILKVLW